MVTTWLVVDVQGRTQQVLCCKDYNKMTLENENINQEMSICDFNSSVEKLYQENDVVQQQITSLEKDVGKCCATMVEMKQTQDNFSINFAKLLKSVKIQLEQKDNKIADLEAKLKDRNNVSKNVQSEVQNKKTAWTVTEILKPLLKNESVNPYRNNTPSEPTLKTHTRYKGGSNKEAARHQHESCAVMKDGPGNSSDKGTNQKCDRKNTHKRSSQPDLRKKFVTESRLLEKEIQERKQKNSSSHNTYKGRSSQILEKQKESTEKIKENSEIASVTSQESPSRNEINKENVAKESKNCKEVSSKQLNNKDINAEGLSINRKDSSQHEDTIITGNVTKTLEQSPKRETNQTGEKDLINSEVRRKPCSQVTAVIKSSELRSKVVGETLNPYFEEVEFKEDEIEDDANTRECLDMSDDMSLFFPEDMEDECELEDKILDDNVAETLTTKVEIDPEPVVDVVEKPDCKKDVPATFENVIENFTKKSSSKIDLVVKKLFDEATKKKDKTLESKKESEISEKQGDIVSTEVAENASCSLTQPNDNRLKEEQGNSSVEKLHASKIASEVIKINRNQTDAQSGTINDNKRDGVETKSTESIKSKKPVSSIKESFVVVELMKDIAEFSAIRKSGFKRKLNCDSPETKEASLNLVKELVNQERRRFDKPPKNKQSCTQKKQCTPPLDDDKGHQVVDKDKNGLQTSHEELAMAIKSIIPSASPRSLENTTIAESSEQVENTIVDIKSSDTKGDIDIKLNQTSEPKEILTKNDSAPKEKKVIKRRISLESMTTREKSGRVLRSAVRKPSVTTTKNVKDEELPKSICNQKNNESQIPKINDFIRVEMSHDGEIPRLHSNIDNNSTNQSLFDLTNVSTVCENDKLKSGGGIKVSNFEKCSITTSTPLPSSRKLSLKRNISGSEIKIQNHNTISSQQDVENKSVNESSEKRLSSNNTGSSNCGRFRSPAERKRRKIISFIMVG